MALGTTKRLQGERYVSAAARGVVTLLQPPLVATAVTSADQPAVRRPRSCSCAGGSTWMATELRDRAEIRLAAGAACWARKVELPPQVVIATSHHHRHKSSSLLCGGYWVALGTPKRLQGERYVSAAARGVVTLLQPPLVATAVTSADQPAVRRPRSCSCAGGSTWMATELRDRAEIRLAVGAACWARKVELPPQVVIATSHHHRHKSSSLLCSGYRVALETFGLG